jgi:hypothetical protein
MSICLQAGQVTDPVTGPVEAHEAHEAQVTPPVARPVTPLIGGRPESRPEWFNNGARNEAALTALALNLSNGTKVEAEARETDKALKAIQEKIGA